MHRSKSVRSFFFAPVLVTIGSLLLVSCAEPSPEEKVEAIRSSFSAELNSFTVMQEPMPDEPLSDEPLSGEPLSGETLSGEPTDGEGATEDGEAMDDESATADESDAAGDDAMADLMPPVPVERDVLLDILLQNTGSESLPGITVDITQVDSTTQVKATWKALLEIPNLAFGSTEQVAHVLEGVDYEEGDGFNVEIRSPVPAEERSQYAEF